MRAKRGNHGNISRVPARYQNAPDPARIVTRIKSVPATADIDFHPGIEIHRRRVWRHADIAKIPITVTRRDIQAAAKRNGKVGEIAANPDLLVDSVRGGASDALPGN
jgi:hypothetical protein